MGVMPKFSRPWIGASMTCVLLCEMLIVEHMTGGRLIYESSGLVHSGLDQLSSYAWQPGACIMNIYSS